MQIFYMYYIQLLQLHIWENVCISLAFVQPGFINGPFQQIKGAPWGELFTYLVERDHVFDLTYGKVSHEIAASSFLSSLSC